MSTEFKRVALHLCAAAFAMAAKRPDLAYTVLKKGSDELSGLNGLEREGRDSGDGVSLSSNLHDSGPARIDGLTSESVDLDAHFLIPSQSVDEAKFFEGINRVTGGEGAGATDYTAKLTFGIKDGNPFGAAGEGVVALFLHQGEYFIVIGQEWHSVESLRKHVGGCSGERLQYANSRVLGYFLKYVAKGI